MGSDPLVHCPHCGAMARTYEKCPGCKRWPYEFGIEGIAGGLLAYVLGVAGAVALLFASWSWSSFGYTLVLLVPALLGVLCGYIILWNRLGQFLVATASLTAILAGAILWGFGGVLCCLILAAIFLIPLLLGIAIGRRLRRRSQAVADAKRGQTALWWMGLCCLLATGIYGESFVDPSRRVVEVRTSRTLEIPAEEAWRGLTFYEDVSGEGPPLLRFALPQPVQTVGRTENVGDVTVCIYDKGRLVKRVRQLQPPHRLVFDVIEQRGVEDRSVRLVDGSFQFQELGSGRTRATLTTRYRPLLSARLVWRPFETAVARALHERVLEAIEERGGRLVGP